MTPNQNKEHVSRWLYEEQPVVCTASVGDTENNAARPSGARNTGVGSAAAAPARQVLLYHLPAPPQGRHYVVMDAIKQLFYQRKCHSRLDLEPRLADVERPRTS